MIWFILGSFVTVLVAAIYYRRSTADLKRHIRSLNKPLRHAEILDLVQRSDPVADWQRTLAGEVGEKQTFSYRKDPRIHIQMNHEVQREDFREPWANMFLHPKATGYYCWLYFESVLICEFILVAVDGGRALLPAPSTSDGRVSPLSYQVAQIVGDPSALDEYFAHSGLEMAQNNPEGD